MTEYIIDSEDTQMITTFVNNEPTIIESIEIGPQGIPGPRGETGDSTNFVVYPAGQILSGHRMVVLDSDGKAIYADRTIPEHANKVFGMTIGAAMQDADANIQIMGELTEPSWAWTLDIPIWLSVNGLLTQTIPTSGFSLIIGFPITATKIFIDIHEPIFLL
jgi:hypothetical protein